MTTPEVTAVASGLMAGPVIAVINAKLDPVTGKKMGLSDFETISSNVLTNPDDWEMIDIDGKGVLNTKKRDNLLSYMNTKNLENVDIDIMPNEKKEKIPLGEN